jgi:carboxyl-terminal processing protease
MNRRYLILVLLLLALFLIAGFMIGVVVHPGNYLIRKPGSGQSGNKLGTIIQLIDSEYVDSVNTPEIIEKTIPEMLGNLDPHTTYIPASDMKDVEEDMQGNFSGIGVQFSIYEDTIMIVDVVSGGPSAKLGILPGDRIVTINDSIFAGTGIKNEQVLKLLRGTKGTHVKIGIHRRGFSQLLGFDIIRGEIPIYSVDVSYMINSETGFVKISRFAEQTYEEFTKAMQKLDKSGAKKVIIDLRGNPGGYLNIVLRILDDFLGKGEPILYTQGKSQPRKTYNATAHDAWIDKNVIVLIDEFSASASEILAGAIQDNDRGIVIGRRSYGKGLVQEQIPFGDGSAIRLSVARYYTPSGRSIQKSYKEGNEKYFEDLFNRMVHGEFEVADSIHFADSLKYKTKSGRSVYGGGGIMPDIFVPADTSGRSQYFMDIIRTGLIYQYALQYTDQNRNRLAKIKTASDIEKLLEEENVMEEFIRFAASKGVQPDPKGLKESETIISTQLKAYISRNILGEEGFYPILQKIDKTLLKAIEISEKNLLVENLGNKN